MPTTTSPALLRPLVTWLLVGACIAVFALEYLAASANPTVEDLIGFGGMSRDLIGNGLGAWRIVTASLLHASPEHLVGNMVCTLIAGTLLERQLGHRRTALLIVGSGLAAACASLALTQFAVVSVGESGIAFGIFGGCIGLDPRCRGVAARVALGLAAFGLFSSLGPGVDWAEHIGGLAGGLVLGNLLGATLPVPVPAQASVAAADPRFSIQSVHASATTLPPSLVAAFDLGGSLDPRLREACLRARVQRTATARPLS
ncbi:MAG: hypothetical protein JWM98_2563 [Thermoleophilia bacterium]|nr:hypothetical protein [Thermoleophilia bacterium]